LINVVDLIGKELNHGEKGKGKEAGPNICKLEPTVDVLIFPQNQVDKGSQDKEKG